jgi:hypothetical protein
VILDVFQTVLMGLFALRMIKATLVVVLRATFCAMVEIYVVHRELRVRGRNV